MTFMTWQNHFKPKVVANKESNSSCIVQDSLNLLKDLAIRSFTPKHIEIKNIHKETQLYLKKLGYTLITFVINFLGTLIFFQKWYDQYAGFSFYDILVNPEHQLVQIVVMSNNCVYATLHDSQTSYFCEIDRRLEVPSLHDCIKSLMKKNLLSTSNLNIAHSLTLVFDTCHSPMMFGSKMLQILGKLVSWN